MSDLVQKIRGEFEAWLKSEYPQKAWSTARYLEDDGSVQYSEDFVEGAWRAWQVRQSLGSAQERGEAVAWMTEDGERCVTERTMAGARKDGGAMLSSLSAYVVPLTYAHPTPDAGRVAELEAELAEANALIQAHQIRPRGKSVVAAVLDLEAQLTESREREGRMREALGLVIDLSSKEWQESDGSRKGATDNQGRRLWFISPDVMQAVVAALAAEKERRNE